MREKEKLVKEIKFKVHKFNPRPKPKDQRNIVFIPMFSEFGCETMASVYCLPAALKSLSGKYVIVLGWHGREFLYKHLVDEFWEIDSSLMWLKNYSKAFHHVSRNLKKFETKCANQGRVLPIHTLSNIAIFPKMDVCADSKCGGKITLLDNNYQKCEKCEKTYSQPGLFTDLKNAHSKAYWLPKPSESKLQWAEKNLPPNAVGIFARNRKTYQRNLPIEFYERLIILLEDLGYNPVWMGDKIDTHVCPVSRIMDYSSKSEASDLEQTFAVSSKMKFTGQYFTAASRIAGMVGTPFLLFESSDQIWGRGQEGMRLQLLTRGVKKIVASTFKNCAENLLETLRCTEKAILEMERGNFKHMVFQANDRPIISKQVITQSLSHVR